MKCLYVRLLVGLLCLSGFASVGCESPSSTKSDDKAKVDVNVGGGKGIEVDVEGREPADPDKKQVDVDVDIGGGDGIKVDLDGER